MADMKTYKDELDLKAYPNELTPDVDNDYTVKVNTKTQALTDEDIANDVAILSGKYTKEEALLFGSLYAQAVAGAVANGYNVSTQLFYARPMASGVLMDDELSLPIDREKIKVYASLSAGPALKERMANTKLNLFTQPALTGPYIAGMTSTEYTDDNATTRAPMEGGTMAVITGRNLKLVGSDPTVGITLTSVANPSTSVFIPKRKVNPNQPSKLQFILPAEVTEGEWRVKVATQYMSGGAKETKEPRVFELPNPIVIGEASSGGQTGGGGTEPGGEETLG